MLEGPQQVRTSFGASTTFRQTVLVPGADLPLRSTNVHVIMRGLAQNSAAVVETRRTSATLACTIARLTPDDNCEAIRRLVQLGNR